MVVIVVHKIFLNKELLAIHIEALKGNQTYKNII